MSIQGTKLEKTEYLNFYTQRKEQKELKNDSLYNYFMTPPSDEYRNKRIVTEDELIYLNNAVETTGIRNYSWSLLKDNHIAIKKSQSHLIDLIRYYEGDSNHYYEAISVAYKDKGGNKTIGFGEWLKEANTKVTTQKKAYAKLSEHIKEHAKYVKNKVGAKAYEEMPSSIKEALIDLSFNKGPEQIGKIIKNAVEQKDWSKVVANIYCLKIKGADKEDPGLYRRSLSRTILAIRDLSGKEKEEAKKEIDNLYKRAVECFKDNGVLPTELNNIYEQYKTGTIKNAPVSAESAKIKVDKSFAGKGLFAVAQKAYNSLSDKQGIEFKDFYEEFIRINKNPESIVLGSELNVPYLKNINQNSISSEAENISSVKLVNVSEKEINKKEETVKEKEEPKKDNIFIRALRGIKNFFVNLWNKFFGKKQEVIAEKERVPKNPFERVLFNKNTKIESRGELNLYTLDHKIQKGETLWRLSRKYGFSEDALSFNNNLEDKTKIKEGEILKIQKAGYLVKKRDNLYQISKKFGVSIAMLKDLNNIEDINQIKENQILEIPAFEYEIKPGDTYYSISKRFDISLDKLMELNNITTSTKMKPGEKLLVVYNDSDYAVTDNRRDVKIDKNGQCVKTEVNMEYIAGVSKRPLLRKKTKTNGIVDVIRAEYSNPKINGPLSGKTIIVNAGHGYSQAGIDTGAEGVVGAEDEWLYNYDNAMRIKNHLVSKGAKVIFLQGHVNTILQELKKKENSADMFVSVHVNSFKGKTNDRTQIYYSTKAKSVGSKLNKKSQKLAKIMEKNFDNIIPKIEKIREEDKFILNGKQDYAQSDGTPLGVCTQAEVYRKTPSVLWETAFMVARKGRERLQNPELMDKYAGIMTESIVEYFS